MFPTGFKPLLAEKADLDKVRFPVLASPKLDGIRCHVAAGAAPRLYSRNLKPIPNRHAQEILGALPAGFDGELLTYTDGKRDDFNVVQSKLMAADGRPNVRFHAFDWFADDKMPFEQRIRAVRSIIPTLHKSGALPVEIEAVPHALIQDAAELMAYEDVAVREGWEGIMIRDPAGLYKFGRSTAREGILLKVKRFEDDEATIIGLVERMHNGNEATKDELGRTKRSSHKANLVGTGTLGAFEVEWRGVRFQIGTGMDDATRAAYWAQGEALHGKLVTFKYQGVGSKGAPRFPVFIGLRVDIS